MVAELRPDGMKSVAIVTLDSRGGDVDEAMAIGRAIRSVNAIALVEPGAICASSCVLVLAGAVQRVVQGKVGIHRPYVDVAAATTAEAQKISYAAIRKKVIDYLGSMNISPRLYDDMFAVPPEKVRILSARELQHYGLNEADPYWISAVDARIAKSKDITMTQWLEVKARCYQTVEVKHRAECEHRVLEGD